MARDLETRVFTPVVPPEQKKQEQDFLRFVEYMNQKAAEIGMTDSHFCDAAGMHNTNIGGFYISDYLPGDTVTYEDAFYALMLESSNVTAQALARSVGRTMGKI